MDRNSPSISDTSSDNPDNEIEEFTQRVTMMDSEDIYSPQGISTYTAGFRCSGGVNTSIFSSMSGVFNSKKRMPAVPLGGSSARDPKTRRKDVRAPAWEQSYGSARGPRGDEPVDVQLVEHLRIRKFRIPCCLRMGICGEELVGGRRSVGDEADHECRIRRSVR